jgi:2-alkyl-3-oxoalkanoate reductase
MRIVITGATGFLGSEVARQLKHRHDVLGTGRNLAKGRLLVRDGISFAVCNLADQKQLARVCRDAEVIIHCAALSSLWAPSATFKRINVDGTQNVIDAARNTGARLVHISSPSVLANARHNHNLDEETPLPRKALNHYIQSKRDAELLVKSAPGLRAVVLRPRGIIGAGDEAVLPRITRALSKGRLPLIGSHDPLVDLTVIDNAAQAVVLAAEGPSSIEGRTYHVTNGQPLPLSRLTNVLCTHLDLSPPHRRIPFRAAWLLGLASELICSLPYVSREPVLTRYGVTLLGCTTTLDISAIQDELGYRPTKDVFEGIAAFADWWRLNR